MSSSSIKRLQEQPGRVLSASPSPGPSSPRVLGQRSPFGIPLRSCVPEGATILHSASCPNKEIDILNHYVVPGSTFPNTRLELGCTLFCCVHLTGNKDTGNTPILAPAPRPMGFQTALAKVFGDQNVNAIDAQALAELAAMASSYQPSPTIPATPQVPNSQPAQEAMELEPTVQVHSSLALIPYVPESSVPELPMDLGNNQNSKKNRARR